MRLMKSTIVSLLLLITTNSANAAEYPVLFVHGWCSNSNTWNTMFDNLSRERFGEELLRLHQGVDGSVYLENLPTSNRTRSFAIDFYDRTNDSSNSTLVAGVPINVKAEQLKVIIDEIRRITKQPKVIIVSHSMGGLVARAYIQGWGLGLLGEPIAYNDDVAGLITIGTPHSGAHIANLSTDIFPWDDPLCRRAETVNKKEMVPESSLLANINNKPWPNDTRLDLIVSYYLQTSYDHEGIFIDGDGVVARDSQDIKTISDYWATHSRVKTHPYPILEPFRLDKEVLHTAILKSLIVPSRIQSIVKEIDQATLDSTTIGGRVYDAANPRLLSGVTVEIVGTGLRTVTDANGNYRLDGINFTTFTVRYSHPNYGIAERVYTFQLGSGNLNIDVGLTPNGSPSSQYDGSWSGQGVGVDITFQVSNNIINSFTFQWKINTPPGTKESSFCGGNGRAGNIKIDNNSFVLTSANSNYSTKITGTFTSQNTVKGTAEFIRQSGAQPWCQSATLNWNGKK